jgi:hypothetical protein
MRPPAWWLRTLAYLFVVAMGAYGLWLVQDNRLDDRAQDCVNDWERVDGTRAAIGLATVAGAEALIEVFPEASPERIVAYRAAIGRRATAARNQIPDPRCDLAAAERRLE